MTDTQFRIRVDEDADLDTAQELVAVMPEIEMEAITGPPSPGVEGQIEPVTAILVGAGVTAAVKFLMDWWEKRRGGLVVDQRPDAKDDIYRDRDIPFGYVLIYPSDGGEVKLETKDMPKDAMHQLLESVISGAYKSFSELAKAAKETLGDDKVQATPSNT